jgi:hypothetical protein
MNALGSPCSPFCDNILIVVTGGGIHSLRSQRFAVQLDPGTEIDPEQVYEACNRIVDEATDIAALPNNWQKTLRWHLERSGAPSMSHGDWYELWVTRGSGEVVRGHEMLARWSCELNGWSVERGVRS